LTADLRALAREIARELAAADRSPSVSSVGTGVGAAPAGGGGGGGTPGAPPHFKNTARAPAPPHQNAAPVIAAPRGVRFMPANARIADFIDHTLLKAEATQRDIERLCDEAAEHRFAAVCVNPVWVPLCAGRLGGTAVQVATVIGFPLGANASATKRDEARRAVAAGATELDMVAAIGHAKGGDWHYVADDIAAVVDGAAGTLVKVIIESSALTPVEIIKACALAQDAGAQYVKTSTGFHPTGGASAEAVALMRLVVGDALGVKASGGVRDCETALRMIASGATRIGTSSGVSMAKCLGVGPLPVEDLLSLASAHQAGCATCGVAPPGGASAY
jgi:deoxyribose-phosphate aldolase